MTLHISLPRELESKVHNQVSEGLFQSASEVVHEALEDFFSRQNDWAIVNPVVCDRLEELNSGKVCAEEFTVKDLEKEDEAIFRETTES